MMKKMKLIRKAEKIEERVRLPRSDAGGRASANASSGRESGMVPVKPMTVTMSMRRYSVLHKMTPG